MFVAFNEWSLHGQFAASDVESLVRALLSLRKALSDGELSLTVRRAIAQRPIDAAGLTLEHWLRTRRRGDALAGALRLWLDRDGPFLEDALAHNSGATYECEDDASATHTVTDTAIAEAAERQRIDHEALALTVSASPSRWQRSGLDVRCDAWPAGAILSVQNLCALAPLQAWIERARPLRSWTELRDRTHARCPRLLLTDETFAPLRREPFNQGAATRLLQRLLVLDALAEHCVGAGFDAEGMRLRAEHFVGDKAWFSDSSAGEKVDFEDEMTFTDPRTHERRFCPWHGKVKTPQLRIHYDDRFREGEKVFVPYVGPKITKR